MSNTYDAWNFRSSMQGDMSSAVSDDMGGRRVKARPINIMIDGKTYGTCATQEASDSMTRRFINTLAIHKAEELQCTNVTGLEESSVVVHFEVYVTANVQDPPQIVNKNYFIQSEFIRKVVEFLKSRQIEARTFQSQASKNITLITFFITKKGIKNLNKSVQGEANVKKIFQQGGSDMFDEVVTPEFYGNLVNIFNKGK